MKNRIYEFDPVIYPVKIWVSVTCYLRPISEQFVCYPSGDPLDSVFAEKMERFAQLVIQKETGMFGVLLVFRSKKVMSAGKIAHEAVHAARKIWGHISEGDIGWEADAYLVEWITKCADDVRKNKSTHILK
jgi:hypothetical protein